MPIWLRKFTFSKLKEFYEESNTNTETDDKIQQGIKEIGGITPAMKLKMAA